MDLLYRALFGGVIVSLFAILGAVIKPKSLGGTTAAAPAIALASVALTAGSKGLGYAALEARSMVAGAVAFLIYALVVSRVEMRRKPKASLATAALLPLWGVAAALLWAVWLRR